MDTEHLTNLFLLYIKKYILISIRYTAFTGALYTIFYIWKRKQLSQYKIQPAFPHPRHIRREVQYSFLSLAIIALVGTGLDLLRGRGYTKLYTQINTYGWGYFVLSVLAFIIIHDAYFYWTHRFLHWPRIYPYVHKLHHLSYNPSPWAAFSFHPLEALVQVAVLPLLAFLLPLHPLAILAWIFYQTAMNVMGHLGFEFFPAGFASGRFTRWHNTATHHNMHHKYIHYNYGLYYNFWDRIMGTNHPHYAEEFEAVTQRATHPQSDGATGSESRHE